MLDLYLHQIIKVMKYITIKESEKVYERIRKEYAPPTFNGQALFTLPEIDFKAIFGERKKMDVTKVTAEIRSIISAAIEKQ